MAQMSGPGLSAVATTGAPPSAGRPAASRTRRSSENQSSWRLEGIHLYRRRRKAANAGGIERTSAMPAMSSACRLRTSSSVRTTYVTGATWTIVSSASLMYSSAS